MSTALLLLLGVATATVLAVLIPQEPTNAATVAHWRAGAAGPGPFATVLLDSAGLFDVMGSWWFRGLSGLLVVSLVACLVPRHRALVRSWRRPPPAGRALERLAHRVVLKTPLDPDEAILAARAALRRQRHRCHLRLTDDGHAQLAAERGVRAREAGSVLFHDAVLLLLLGVAIGQVFGFTGQVDLVEGARFAETRLSYDRVTAGPGFGLDDHRGFVVGLEAFRTSDHPNGTPREFVATVAVDGGAPVEVEVNHPLLHDGMRVHLARHGLAPTIRVTDTADGTVLFDGPVLLASAGPLAWAGLAIVRDAGVERVIDVVLLPHATVDADGRPSTVGGAGPAGDALLVADLYPGEAVRDDGARRTIDRRVGAIGATAVTRAGVTAPIGDGTWTVTFDEPVRWAGLQVSHLPGLRVLLVAGLLLLGGLVTSLYATPQRLWVSATPTPMATGTTLVIAGVARHRPWAFDRTFPAVVRAIERRSARSH